MKVLVKSWLSHLSRISDAAKLLYIWAFFCIGWETNDRRRIFQWGFFSNNLVFLINQKFYITISHLTTLETISVRTESTALMLFYNLKQCLSYHLSYHTYVQYKDKSLNVKTILRPKCMHICECIYLFPFFKWVCYKYMSKG